MSIAIEKGIAPQTLLAVVTDESATIPNNNISNSIKNVKKSLDVDSEGTKLSVEQIKRYKNVAPELRDEQGRITQFRVNGKPITEYWYTLSAKQKQKLTQKIKQVTFDDDYKTIILKPGNEFELIKNNDAEPLTNVGGTTKKWCQYNHRFCVYK